MKITKLDTDQDTNKLFRHLKLRKIIFFSIYFWKNYNDRRKARNNTYNL
jgi:hypothetical protein